MTRIFFVRHGEPEIDPQGRGRLNGRGKAQAVALAARLADEQFVAAYASPFPYTRETAAALASPLHLEVRPHVLVRDVDFGSMSAFMEQFAKTDPYALARWWAEQKPDMQFPGGESVAGLRRRVRRFVNQMGDRHPNSDVLVVTHDSTIRVAICLAQELGDDHHFEPELIAPLASLTVVRVTLGQTAADRGVMLEMSNDVSHLATVAPEH